MLERNSGKADKNFYSDIKRENNTGLMTWVEKISIECTDAESCYPHFKKQNKTYFKASKNVDKKYLHLSHTRSLVQQWRKIFVKFGF